MFWYNSGTTSFTLSGVIGMVADKLKILGGQ
jgi:hypothetical protein